jgi:hypothetical protein
LPGKRSGRQRQPHGTGRKGNQMHQLQSLLIRKKRAMEKLGKFNYTGTFPDRAKVKGVKLDPVVEELPLEPPPKKQRKTRKMAEKLRDSFNERPRNRIRHA